MTDMKRISVSLPDGMVAALDEIKQTDDFSDRPYSELIRTMIQRGLDKTKRKGGRV
jgi:metal-responsive CopG/Arc/MetJ family transcriptional regulator